MAHYAILDKNNLVIQVIVGKDESEQLYNQPFDWELYYGGKRTSYNTRAGEHTAGGLPFRKNFAGIGYSYDPQRDAFIPPKPYNSWILDETTCLWTTPTPMPTDGKQYKWDEDTTSWIVIPPE